MIRWQHAVSVLLTILLLQSATQDDKTDNRITEIFHKCICVRYFQCNENNTIIEEGESIIEERLGDEEGRIKCKGGAFDGDYVCCKKKEEISINTKAPPTDDTTEISCGYRKTPFGDRIFNPDESEQDSLLGEFPWIAALFRKNNDGGYDFITGGTLIHPKVILTVVHKFRRANASDLKVILNGRPELPELGNNTSEERNVEEIVRHNEFHNEKLYYDIALLFLDKPFSTKAKYVNTICLPPDDMDLNGVNCVVAGWGKQKKEDGGKRLLKQVTVPFVEHDTCQVLFRNTRLGPFFKLHKTFLCAGGQENKDACKGDGGSPLMCPFSPGEPQHFVAGMVAWGIGCGQKNIPGAYVNVKEFNEWIKKELSNKKLKIA